MLLLAHPSGISVALNALSDGNFRYQQDDGLATWMSAEGEVESAEGEMPPRAAGQQLLSMDSSSFHVGKQPPRLRRRRPSVEKGDFFRDKSLRSFDVSHSIEDFKEEKKAQGKTAYRR